MKLTPGLASAFVLSGLTLFAQQPATTMALNVVAVDSAGNPVTDLAAADFKVLDNGSRQPVTAVHLNQAESPRPIVILFDLMNSNLDSRGAIWTAMKTSLAHLPATDPVYLYLLVEDGSLYAVHGIRATGDNATGWPGNVAQLLDAAMQKVTQLKPLEVKFYTPARFDTTCHALDDLRTRMTALPGPKELLWVTYGIPSSIQFADRTWFDGGPTLRQIGAQFVKSDITVYTAEPGINVQNRVLSRDSLDIFTSATGGRAFSTIDMQKAISQIQAAARTNYTVEYQPSSVRDGKYHKLKVTVERKGVHLQSESGYYAIAG
ncbi:MAG: VWA domain-containing protein [Bryobacteraceae bacterium]